MIMRTLLCLFVVLAFLLPAMTQTAAAQAKGKKSNIVYVNVNIDQPNVDDCYGSSVGELQFEQWLKVYPNPNHGEFIVEMERLKFGETVNITVLNTTGKNVHQTSVKVDGEHFQLKLKLGYLPKGVYLLYVHAARGVRVQRLVIL